MVFREPVERLDDLGKADRIGITQRPAAEGGKTGPEDHRQIDVIGTGHDVFIEATGRLVNDRIDQALHDRFVRERFPWRG